MSNCFSCYDNLVKLENDAAISAHKTDVSTNNQIFTMIDKK